MGIQPHSGEQRDRTFPLRGKDVLLFLFGQETSPRPSCHTAEVLFKSSFLEGRISSRIAFSDKAGNRVLPLS